MPAAVSWSPREEHRPQWWLRGTEPGGFESYHVDDSGDAAWVAGAVLNGRELAARLEFPEASPAALVTAACRRWGDEAPGEVRCSGTWVVWLAAQRVFYAVRDALGTGPCYYAWDGGTLRLSDDLEAVLQLLPGSTPFNRVALAEHVADWTTPARRGETLYRDVARLPAAHALRLDQTGLHRWRYWDPLPAGFAWATEAEAESFPDLLEQALERCLAAGADSIALSGGFDSVSLAVLSRDLTAGCQPLRAVSLRFDGGACDEGTTQAAVAAALGMPQTLLTVADSLDGREPLDVALGFSRCSPNPVASPFQALYTGLFRCAREVGARRMLFGTGGDDLLNVDSAYGADCLARLRLGALWRFLRATQRTSSFSSARVARLVLWDDAGRPALRGAVRGVLSRTAPGWWERQRVERLRRAIPAWLGPIEADLLDHLVARRLATDPLVSDAGRGRYVRVLQVLGQSPRLLDDLEQGHAWLSQFGLSALYPYFDRDVVTLLLRVHPERLIAGGWYKEPVRRLVRERLPDISLPRKKVDFTQAMRSVLRPAGERAWSQLDGVPCLEALGICSQEAVNEMMCGYLAGEHDRWTAFWLILSTESWLQAQSGPRTRGAT